MPELVIDQRRRSLGGGLEVGRILPFAQRRMVGPFIFFDHMGPVDFPKGVGRDVDVRPHPHIGLSTITYLFAGEVMHRDSVGSEQPIFPGEVNWMIAGRGITHSERFERARADGGPLHGIQAWVALPEKDEETEPSFAHHGREDLPFTEDGGVWTRIIAGEAYGLRALVTTHSPIFYAHQALAAGASTQLPAQYSERAVYVVSGQVDADGESFVAGQMLVFAPGRDAVVRATTPALLMALGGEPLGERFIEWNFVSSSRDRIEQAKADWRAGRFPLPRNDDRESIPLPEDQPPPPAPMMA